MYTLCTEDMHTSMHSHLPMQTDLDVFGGLKRTTKKPSVLFSKAPSCFRSRNYGDTIKSPCQDRGGRGRHGWSRQGSRSV